MNRELLSFAVGFVRNVERTLVETFVDDVTAKEGCARVGILIKLTNNSMNCRGFQLGEDSVNPSVRTSNTLRNKFSMSRRG